MANYFRITAYHPAKNVCAVFDSNGRFEKLWHLTRLRKGTVRHQWQHHSNERQMLPRYAMI